MVGMIVCPTCEGDGKVRVLLGGLIPWRSYCSSCGGSGQVPADFVAASLAGAPRRARPSFRTVRTKVIVEHWTTTEVDSFAAAHNSAAPPAAAAHDDPRHPLIVDPFAAADEPPAPEDPDSPEEDASPAESSDAGDPDDGDSDSATAY